jgi:hypothetical protein
MGSPFAGNGDGGETVPLPCPVAWSVLIRQQDGNDRLALVAWAALFTCCLWSTKVGASAGELDDVNDKKVAGTAFSRFK